MKQIVAALAFLRRNDEILLAMKKRGLGEGKWNGAGGKVTANETVEQALVRESQEEICVTPTAYAKVAYHVFTLNADTDKPFQMLVHTYIVTKWRGEPTESEEMAPKWFKIANIPYEDMWESDTLWLPKVLAGDLVESKVSFGKNDSMLSSEVVTVAKL